MDAPRFKTATLRIGATELPITSMDGVEAISELFRYEVKANVRLPTPSIEELIGATASVAFDDVFGSSRAITGLITEAEVRAFDNERGEVFAVVEPFVRSLSVGRRSRSFQDTSVLDVARTVLGEAGISFRENITKVYAKAPYRAQLREDSWSFVCRLLEGEGIHFVFDTDGSGTLVLADDSTSASPMEGATALPVIRDSGMTEAVECIVDLVGSARAGTTAVAGKSFSWSSPSLGLASSHGGGRYEAYDSAPAGPSTPSGLNAHTARGMARLKAHASSVAGRACSLRLAPGRSIEIIGGSNPELDGAYHVTRIRIVMTGSDRAFLTDFEAGSLGVSYVPEELTRVPSQAGIAWGQVIADAGDEVFPDESARVRVQMKWDREGARDASAGTWMRVAQRGAPGSLLMPRTGWVVATWNEGGTPDAPYVLSRIHDGEHLPAYKLPDNKTRVVYKTATVPGGGTFNEIHFEDKVAAQNVFWNASKDLDIHTKKQKAEFVKRDATHDVDRDQTIQVGGDANHMVRLDQLHEVGHDERVHIHGSATQDIDGNETIQIGGSRKLNVGASHTLSSAVNRDVSVGAAEIDVSLGSITQSTKVGLELVGAAKISLTPQARTEGSDKASVQVVGGIVIEKAGKDSTLDVKGNLTETIGVSLTMEAGERFSDVTTTSSSWTVGGSLNVSTDKEISIEAKKKIELRCGASFVVITDGSISLSTTRFLLEGGELEAVTGIIRHN